MGILKDFYDLLFQKVQSFETNNTTDQDVLDFFNEYVNTKLQESGALPVTLEPGKLFISEISGVKQLYYGNGLSEPIKILDVDEILDPTTGDIGDAPVVQLVSGVKKLVMMPVSLGVSEEIGILKYEACYSQGGTANPVLLQVAKNSTGATVSVLRAGVGIYTVNFSLPIVTVPNKAKILPAYCFDGFGGLSGFLASPVILNGGSQMTFYTYDLTNTLSDDLLLQTPLHVEIGV